MKSKGRSAAVFTITLLMATLMPTFMPRAGAMPVVTSLEPTSGPVGTLVRVIGEIDTPGGTYQFLWDGKTIKNDSCTAESKMVNGTFRVPPSTMGEHNVTLRDVTSSNATTPVLFTVTTTYRLLPKPRWVQEGLNTGLILSVNGGSANTSYRFTVIVIDPTGQNHTANLSVAMNSSGSGQNTIRYYADFPSGAHTNYLGTYQVTANQTLATTAFTVGLTDAAEYKRLETVYIRGSGYLQPDEQVWINLTFGGENVFSNKTSAANGVVEASWEIPANASLGTYSVTLKSATVPGTTKPLADAQNFTVVKLQCLVQTKNLDGEPVANVTVELTDEATSQVLDRQKTNGTGWAKFLLKTGNYTFTALWKDEKAEISRLSNQVITGNSSLILECKLAQLRISVKDRDGAPISLVNITLAYNYTMSNGQKTLGVDYLETNHMGLAAVNTLVDVKYRIEARRYDQLFNETLIERLTASRWVNITCPTYTLSINVLDSRQLPVSNLQVAIYKWTVYDQPIFPPQVTNETGGTVFHLPLGRYKVSVLSYSQKLGWVPLNETILDLFEDRQAQIHCKLLNLDLSVAVVDFFGNPFPNVIVKVEREGVEVKSSSTGSNGRVSLPNLIGGDYSISIYWGETSWGGLLGIETFRLDAPKEIVFKVDKYVVIGGNPIETSQLITLISISSMILLIVLALKYKKILQIIPKKKAEKAK